MLTSMAPAIGIAVRLTRSNGETPPMPEETTITAVIGDQLRAIDAAKCIGSSISTGWIPVCAATAGVSAAKAKNGALPLPITTAEKAMIATITSIMAIGPKPKPWLPEIRELIVPMDNRP